MLALLVALRLIVTCDPARPVRGQHVDCAAQLDPPGPLVVTELRADAEGHVLRDAVERHAQGAFRWSGVAATDTRVQITARAGDQMLRGRGSYTVAPRPFPKVALSREPPPWEYGEDADFGGWPPRIGGGSSLWDPIAADGSLGVFRVALPAPRTRYIEDGPNARWFIVGDPVPQPRVRVLISRALRPGDPFYLAQTGGPPIDLRPACATTDVDLLRRGILEHEGAIASELPSHWSETRRAFEERDLQGEVEEMTLFYDQAMSGDPLHEQVRRKLQAFLDATREEQRATVDARAPVRLRCRLSYPALTRGR